MDIFEVERSNFIFYKPLFMAWTIMSFDQSSPALHALLKAVCGGIEELTDYTLLSKGKKEGKVFS